MGERYDGTIMRRHDFRKKEKLFLKKKVVRPCIFGMEIDLLAINYTT